MDTDFLDWALADFSGYVAADELYDGPFCILSAVDNRRYKRIRYCWRTLVLVLNILNEETKKAKTGGAYGEKL